MNWFWAEITESESHRMVCIERAVKCHPALISATMGRNVSLAQVAQSPIQSGIESLQG